MATAAAELKFYLYVPSFHSFAHNQWYQLYSHPLYLCCFRLEDLEICEHVFSASNECTKLMQHMTCFHHLQFLICISHSGMKISMLSLVSFCLFFSLSTDIIPRQLPPQQLQASVRTFNRAVINNCGLAVRNTSYAAHLGAECAYLASLKKEPEAHVFGCQYITLLLKYSHTE